MKTIDILIVDDEPKLRKVLELKVQQHCPQVKVVGQAADISDAYHKIIALRPGIIFLDISMPGGSGFDLLDKFDETDFEVIFVTGFNDYVLDALKISAVDYLLKPVVTEDLIEAVAKAEKRIDSRNKIKKYETLRHNLNHLGKQDTRIAIPGTNAYDFVSVKDIIRCEGWQKYTKIYLADGECLISSYNIGVFKDMLKNYEFYCTHKSHLVNKNRITKYLKEGLVVLSDNSQVPLARRKKEEFLKNILCV